MPKELENMFRNSEKAKLVEWLDKALPDYDKAIVVLIKDHEGNDGYASLVASLGLDTTYEAYGLLEVARQDFVNGNY